MTRTEELLALAEEAQAKKQTFYDGPLDWSDQRQALAYEANPSTIKQLVEVAVLQNTALKESVDLVQQDYDEDWRHGLPSRAKQLAGKLELLNAHKESIAAFERFEKGGE